jgi:rhodanese-related sulfurtransferase
LYRGCCALHLIRCAVLSAAFLYPAAALTKDKIDYCRNEAAYLSNRAQPSNADLSFSGACFIDSLEYQTHRILIDTRSPSSYKRIHALGTVNLPAHQLVAKSQLAQQPLLIVGEGHDRFMAGQLCDRLMQSGFRDVKILLGGIRALLAQGRPANKPLGFNELSYIDAKDTLAELFQNQIYLVAASDTVVETLPELSRLFDFVLDLDDRSAVLNRVSSISRNNRSPTVLVGSEDEYRKLRGLMNSDLPLNLYLLDGGPGAVKKYIRTSKQIQVAMKSVPNRYKCL